MFKLACLLLVLLCQTPAPRAQTTTERPDSSNGDVQELTAIVHEECEGVLENHAAALERIWAKEFRMRVVDGTVLDRTQARPYLRAALPQSVAGLCEISDLAIRVTGRKATTTGRMMIKSSAADGTDTPIQFRFNQRLVRRDGRWQAVLLEFSYVTP